VISHSKVFKKVKHQKIYLLADVFDKDMKKIVKIVDGVEKRFKFR